nr:MAG TPA: Photosystem II protein D1 [Caudoviricetes sp.]
MVMLLVYTTVLTLSTVLCLFFYIFLSTPVRVVENSHKKETLTRKRVSRMECCVRQLGYQI